MRKLGHSDLVKSHGEQVEGLRLELSSSPPNPFSVLSFTHQIFPECLCAEDTGRTDKGPDPAVNELTVQWERQTSVFLNHKNEYE